jgi:glycosyltransferase involved in cell wall biosynthesis
MAGKERKLLYVDMAYTHEIVAQKKHQQFFEMRHSGGYFSRVWGVHPIADVAGKQSRQIEVISFSDRQTVIEGAAEMLPLPRFLLPLNFLISQWRLLRLLKREIVKNDISVIAGTDAYYSGLFSLILKWMTGRPQAVCVFANQDDLYAATGTLAMPRLLPFRFLERLVARLVLSNADLVITGNRNNMGFAVANGAKGDTAIIPVAKNIEPVHLAEPEQRQVPIEIFSRFGIGSDTPLMLFVGRLQALKHPDEAIRAMAAVIKERPEAMGLIAGNGPMQPELDALAASLGAEGKIHFLGHIDQVELSQLIPHCVTVSPLTGMALIECGLGGSPIVAFDRDWQAEFVEDGVNGFIVPFLDHEGLADRVLRLLSDPALYDRVAKASRERALDFADTDRIHALEHAAYDRLLERHGT